MDLEKLKYPIGKFQAPTEISAVQVNSWISIIESLAEKIEATVEGLKDELEWKYRPEGWTIAQVVHHCLDSHLNSLIRFKWALTEDEPTIKPYFEERWIELADVKTTDLKDSLQMLRLLHKKWTILLKSMSTEQLERKFYHPDYDGPLTIAFYIGNYAWHCEHHLAHIKQALGSNGSYN